MLDIMSLSMITWDISKKTSRLLNELKESLKWSPCYMLDYFHSIIQEEEIS